MFFAKLFFKVAARPLGLTKKINKNSKKHATYGLQLPET
jgi:hypothetical protein